MTEVESWMERNRHRRALKALERKVEVAQRRGFKAVNLPLEVARRILDTAQ